MTGMAVLLLGIFLVIEGINRVGFRFQGDEMLKGILLALAGGFLVAEYL